MEAYKHFGLSVPPFESKPDSAFFCALPSHAEALATLQYAVHAGKACTLVVGESGSGKTLLGRILAQAICEHSSVLWVHGIGQPDAETDVTIYPPGATGRAGSFNPKNTEESTLSYWLRMGPSVAKAAVLIVDNADGLRKHNWEDITSLVTREIHTNQAPSVVLLGLPGLLDTLMEPALVRLQRRIFRTCQLDRMTSADVASYVNHRIEIAGGSDIEMFTAPALDLIHRLSRGNPALVSQLCDNAMVDAFGDGRRQIDARHIAATVHAIAGAVLGRYAAHASPKRLAPPSLPGFHAKPTEQPAIHRPAQPHDHADTDAFATEPTETDPPTTTERVIQAAEASIDHLNPAELFTPVAFSSPGPLEPDPAEDTASTHTDADPVVEDEAADQDSSPYSPLDDRLRGIEHRLSDAMSRVRFARSQPNALGPVTPANDSPTDDADGTTEPRPATEVSETTADDGVS